MYSNTGETYLGEDHQPVLLKDGGCGQLYNEREKLTLETLCGLDMQPVMSRAGYATQTVERNRKGNAGTRRETPS